MRKFLIATAAIASLAACASRPEPIPTPTPTPTPQVETPQGPVPGSVEDFRVSVGDRVFFGYDRFDLSSEARSVLERQAAWLRQYPNVRILVAGNADERGTREYNLALGDRRAYAVKEYLVSLGIDAARLQTKSYGKERPVCAESDENCWQQNRRGYSVILSGASS